MIFAGTKGYLDKIEVAQVSAFETGLLNHLRSNHSALMNDIRDNDQKIKGDIEDKIRAAIDEFAGSFA